MAEVSQGLVLISVVPFILASAVVGSIGYAIASFISFPLSLFQRQYTYKDRHVVITGGSSGIGYELAKVYISKGAKVTIIARDTVKLEKAAKELQLYAKCQNLNENNIKHASIDVSVGVEAITKALTDSLKTFGDVDVLINNAGVSCLFPVEDTPESEYQRMLNINVLGSIYTTKALLSSLRRRGNGRIVFISSQAGQVGLHGYSAYSASKYAMKGFADCLQMEVRPDNIFVSMAYPPDTITPMYEAELVNKV